MIVLYSSPVGSWARPFRGWTACSATRAEWSGLRPGDVLYLLLAEYTIPDDPLLVRDDTRYWPWHTAMYVGDGMVLHARPGDTVTEQALETLTWDALYVTRP